jgi:hypothetical protein
MLPMVSDKNRAFAGVSPLPADTTGSPAVAAMLWDMGDALNVALQ